ncbi:uncharacterized protein YutE (UPF0331/DUF86 family) [Geomicrobium halophilum]|uniref:Uncharacterized protein YutE (UPF0331/DUF86 family) n=1 Tax=Geomicrobium halophilum TaxID=549000 RepID=A0A841Q227_9BACL|nr:DUF86 domain-containing protein [Geomicrobium halophilum]MBB6450208.1 uncharacterized protein YutE (UPF0331/DUF86 family) [Geomicrobium halophilum]
MYFVDRSLIEKRLEYMEQLLGHFQGNLDWSGPLTQLALERITQNWLEAMIDVGNQMIDGFIMRDPGSYSDIIDILEDEKVITKSGAEALQAVLTWRKVLVRDYLNIDHEAIEATLRDQQLEMAAFPEAVRDYLEKELGPVSAFLPKEER